MADGPWNDFNTLDSQKPAAGPWQAYGQQAPDQPGREGGILQSAPQAAGMLSTPEGRGQLWEGVKKFPAEFLHGMLDFFETPGKAVKEGVTSEEEVSFGLNAALATVGGRSIPRGASDAIAPAVKSFDDGVIAPAAQRLDAYARTGDVNGVRLEPPIPEVKPAPIRPIEGSPFAGVPRSVAAKTGVPEVDSVLGSPVTKSVIDNAVIDRSHDVPYMAGGSTPLNDPTVYIDRHVPREQTVSPPDPAMDKAAEFQSLVKDINEQWNGQHVQQKLTLFPEEIQLIRDAGFEVGDDGVISAATKIRLTNEAERVRKGIKKPGGVTFDPAEPWSVHENVEQHTMEILTRNGMTDEEAYRVAHFEFAEPAEQAWYRAHGIDQVAAEKEQASWLPRIQHENPGNPPPNLYEKPYPHDHVQGAQHEAVTESPPTPDEKARAFDIIRNAPELQPKSAAPMLQEARELGVIGEDQPQSLNQLPPKEAGQRAMAAQGPPPDKVTGEVGGAPEPSAWRKRWERTLDKMQTPADARALISQAVDANDEFMPARQGDMSAGQVEQLASVAGLDSAKIDVAGTSAKIKTNAEIRNTIEAFRGITDKIQEAAKQLAEKHGADDEAEAIELTRLELQRDLLLNATTSSKEFAALRAEFGRIGNTIQDFMAASRETNAWREFLKDKQGRTIDDVRERARMIADAPPDALPKILEATRGPKPPGWLFWTWQQGLISGLITHTKYLMVNTATVYLERVISPEVAAIMGKMRGDKVSLMAPLWANVGMVKGLGDAFSAAGQAFKTGLRVPLESEIELTRRGEENPELRAAKTPYGQTTGPDWGIWKRVFNEDQLATAAKVLSIPGKSANMIHTFYKVLSERGAAASRAYEAAFEEGATGDRFTDRYNYHLANPTDEALKATVDDAYSGAFMEKLGDKSGTLAKALASNPVSKWMFPFQHIPWNIERMTVNYSPAALVELLGDTRTASALRGDLGHPAQHLAIAKIVVGTSIISYFVDKALSGVATPDYPQDPKERRKWQLLNMQPNSLQVGDQWVEMTRLGPVGNVARIGANLGAIIRNYDGKSDDALMKAIWAGAMAAVNQVGDETGFQTLRNIIDVIDGKQPPGRFLSWQAGSFLPFSSFLSQNASIMDPSARVANGLVDALKYRLPMERETLMPKRDGLYGEPVANPGYHTFMRESPIQTDPAKLELDRLHYYPTPPQKQIGHVKLTDEQYDRYEATAGPLVKQMLNAAISSPHYQTMPDVGREAMLKGIIAAGRARARQAMQMAYPEIIQQGIDARKAQIAGATP